MASQDDYSDIPQEVPLEEDSMPDIENVARGHRATLSNPRTHLFYPNYPLFPFPYLSLRGLTVILGVSDKAKEHSRYVLEHELQEPENETDTKKNNTQKPDSEKDPGNVWVKQFDVYWFLLGWVCWNWVSARGLKASISNPGVSEEAKEKAKAKLQDMEWLQRRVICL